MDRDAPARAKYTAVSSPVPQEAPVISTALPENVWPGSIAGYTLRQAWG